jgi:polysaccharide export outer membrane protein
MFRSARGAASVLAMAGLLGMGGCAGARAPTDADKAIRLAPTEQEVAPLGEYRIGPADLLQLSVWKNEALSRAVPVRPDGMISLPLVNDVRAAGLTPMQLRDVLEKKLAEYMPNPEVSVIVLEVHSFTVSVLGEVKTAGRYEIKSRVTVLDVLARAGGITEFASRSHILILRPEGKVMKRITFDYNNVISAQGEHQNVFVQPGDIIVVP